MTSGYRVLCEECCLGDRRVKGGEVRSLKKHLTSGAATIKSADARTLGRRCPSAALGRGRLRRRRLGVHRPRQRHALERCERAHLPVGALVGHHGGGRSVMAGCRVPAHHA